MQTELGPRTLLDLPLWTAHATHMAKATCHNIRHRHSTFYKVLADGWACKRDKAISAITLTGLLSKPSALPYFDAGVSSRGSGCRSWKPTPQPLYLNIGVFLEFDNIYPSPEDVRSARDWKVNEGLLRMLLAHFS